MACTHLDYEKLCSAYRILRIVGYRQCKNLWKYLEYPKIFSYSMKMWQKISIPHENVAKYFGTPPWFTPSRYLALKMSGLLCIMSLRIVFMCYEADFRKEFTAIVSNHLKQKQVITGKKEQRLFFLFLSSIQSFLL